MEDIKKIEKIASEIQEKRVHCEKCRMTETLVGLPIIMKRKYREWKRLHLHQNYKRNFLKRWGVN